MTTAHKPAARHWCPDLPVRHWARQYDRDTLLRDALAAAIVTLMLIPQSLAYAQLAGLPAQAGLYASIAPLLLYALLIGLSFHFIHDSPKVKPGVDFCGRTLLRIGVALTSRQQRPLAGRSTRIASRPPPGARHPRASLRSPLPDRFPWGSDDRTSLVRPRGRRR